MRAIICAAHATPSRDLGLHLQRPSPSFLIPACTTHSAAAAHSMLCIGARRQTKELNNGRLAMIAIAGMVGQEVATGAELF